MISFANSVTFFPVVVNMNNNNKRMENTAIGTQIISPVEFFITWPVFVIMAYPIRTTPNKNIIVNMAFIINEMVGAVLFSWELHVFTCSLKEVPLPLFKKGVLVAIAAPGMATKNRIKDIRAILKKERFIAVHTPSILLYLIEKVCVLMLASFPLGRRGIFSSQAYSPFRSSITFASVAIH